MKAHQARNRILSFVKENWEEITEYEEVKKVAVKFYEDLFSENNKWDEEKKKKLEKIINKRISVEQAKGLKKVSSEEIKEAVFKMKGNRA